MKVLFILALFPLGSHAADYNLEALYKHALDNHPQGKIYKSEFNELSHSLKKVKSTYYPEVSAVVGGEIRNGGSETEINDERLIAEMRLKYNLFKFGKTKDQLDAMESLVNKKESDYNWWRFQLAALLKQRFYQAVATKKKIAIYKSELSENLNLLKMTQKRHKSGLVGKSDVLEVQERQTLIQVQIIDQEEELDHLFDEIRKLSYIGHADTINIDRPLPHFHVELKLESLISKAESFNKEVRDSLLVESSYRHKLNQIEKNRMPEVNLMGRYGRMRIDEQYTNDSTEGLLGVYVEMPLFDGGNRKSTQEIYIERLKQKVLKSKLVKNSTAVEVTHKFEISYRTHRKVDLLEKAFRQSKRYFNNVVSEYRRGVKNSLDLVSAREHLISIKMDLVNTKESYITNILEIEKLIGEKIQERL